MRWTTLVFAIIAAWGSTAFGQAQNFRGLSITPRIAAGESSYGYAAHRFLINNPGENERSVRIDFDTYDDEAFRVLSGSATVPASSAVELVIYQPPIKIRSASARVTVDGSPVNERIRITMPSHGVEQYDGYYSRYGSSSHRATHVVLVSNAVPGDIVNQIEAQITDPNASRSGYSGSPVSRQTLVSQEPSRNWPTDWLSYSRYLAVVLTTDEFEALPAPVRESLLGSVHVGGNLVLVGGQSPLAGGLGQLTERHALDWGVPPALRSGISPAPGERPQAWSAETEFGFGAILWTDRDQLMNTPVLIGNTMFERCRRTIEARLQLPTLAAAEGAMTVVGELTVPRRMTFLFLVIFVLLVCPVNLILLKRANRRTLLFVTAPVLGLLFSATVFVYGLLHDGISTTSRIEAVSVLDQRSRLCSTTSQLGLYAPLTPKGGLVFANHTEVTPMLGSRGQRLSAGQRVGLEHGDQQRFRSGWVSPREPAHFWTRTHTQRRERVLLETDESGRWSATNGLGVPITAFSFYDAQGNLHSAERIEPGARATLVEQPRTPGYAANDFERLMNGLPSQVTTRLAGTPGQFTRPWSYTAVVEGNLFAPLGIENVNDRTVREVVIGLVDGGEVAP